MPSSSKKEHRGCCKCLRKQQQEDDCQTSSIEIIRPKKTDEETQMSTKSLLSSDKTDLELKISEKSSETYFDGNNQNISSSDNKTCPSNSAKSSQGVVKCPCSLVCKTVDVKTASNCQMPQYVQPTRHKCTCQNFNLPSSSSSNSLPCDQFPVKFKLNSDDRYAYLKNIRNIQTQINTTSFRPERLQPNLCQDTMIYEEFFSCSSSEASEDTDVPTECPCQSLPFKNKNLIILELLQEVVHLISEDSPIREEDMPITKATPSSLDIKCSKTKQQEIVDTHLCPFCNQEIVCGPIPSFAAHPDPAAQPIPEPFAYEESFKDCLSSVESCICEKINDVCPRHGPLKILLNKLQCQTENEKQQYQFDEQINSARSNLPESAHSPVPYPPECLYLQGSESTKSARSPVPYPPECSYLNGPGSIKSSRSTKSSPPECFSITGAGPTKSAHSPESMDEELQPHDHNILAFDKNEPGLTEKTKDEVENVESVEDFRVYKPCRDCLMEYDDEEPWPCLPSQISTPQAGTVEKPSTQDEFEEEISKTVPTVIIEESQEEATTEKLEENQVINISEQDNSQNDTEIVNLAESEQLSRSESKTGNDTSVYCVEENDEENELAKERIAESLKTKEQQEEEEKDDDGGDDDDNTKTSNRSLASTKQTESIFEVCERREGDDDNHDADNNKKNSDTTVATIKHNECGDSANEMKYFIDSLITDLNAMEYARRKTHFEQNVCKKHCLCARDSYPVTITNVSDLGTNALYVQWKIHDCFGIGGYEIYTDGYLTNRYYHSRHDAAVITNVDVTVPHKIALVAQSCADDESIELICNINRDKNKPKSLKWKTDEDKRRESHACLWTPSIFLYDPNTCKAH